jgi:hypothetical protein
MPRFATSLAGAVGVVVGIAIVVHPVPARADVDFQLAGTTGAAWMRALPALRSPALSTAARDVPDARIPVGGSLTWMGAGLEIGMTVDAHIVIPGIGVAAYAAVGSYDTVLTSADGSIATVRPWSAYRIDMPLPGIGYRVKERRWMFQADVRTGLSVLSMNGTIAGGSSETETSLTAISGVLVAEVEACRRLDPVTRVCVQVAPRIYDFGFMNGGTLGLRVEWGR